VYSPGRLAVRFNTAVIKRVLAVSQEGQFIAIQAAELSPCVSLVVASVNLTEEKPDGKKA
jgi:hypothetical protein